MSKVKSNKIKSSKAKPHKEKSNALGQCPICGSYNILYYPPYIDVTDMECIYTCNDCGFYGKELYNIKFITHADSKNRTPEHPDFNVGEK